MNNVAAVFVAADNTIVDVATTLFAYMIILKFIIVIMTGVVTIINKLFINTITFWVAIIMNVVDATFVCNNTVFIFTPVTMYNILPRQQQRLFFVPFLTWY